YVPEDLSSVAETLSCSEVEVEDVLLQLQSFDPHGVGARTLVECLAIQLREKDQLDPAMEKLLANLELMAMGEAKKLAKLCGVEEEDLPYMYAEIRALNPKPGYRFGSDVVQAVIPDVFLRKAQDGGWQVELNSDALPKVLVNRQYYTRIADGARRKEDKKYLSEQLAHANWLTKALDQRAQTILKVTTEIVRQQDMFFRYGIRHFKPLTLRDIAAETDLHESTVSRVTTQKYLSTGNAVYELKYFFSSSVGSTAGGDGHSSEAVKHRIKELIDAEDPKKILSDDAIAETLQDKGIDIARRTVAKYREAMDIPSSPARRKEKKARIAK
ncbi:MAG: RNA polymerase factor sigma-54, partial [Rickettsiales bacterium]